MWGCHCARCLDPMRSMGLMKAALLRLMDTRVEGLDEVVGESLT